MEDDILNDVDTKVPGISGISEVYASIDFSLQAGNTGVTTKSIEGPTDGTLSDMTGSEISIYNCYIAIFEYDSNTGNVGSFLTSHFYEGYEDVVRDDERKSECVYDLGSHIIFKIPKDISKRKDLKIVAIAQTNGLGKTLASRGSISYADLKKMILDEAPTILVKVGETEILKGDDGSYPAGAGKPCYLSISESVLDLDETEDETAAHSPIEITVIQRSAAVMLESFQILKSNGEAYNDVVITDMALEDGKMIGRVSGEVSVGDSDLPQRSLYQDQKVSQVNLGEVGWTAADWANFNEVLKVD